MEGAAAASSSVAEAGGASQDGTVEVSCDEDSGPNGAFSSPRCTEAPTGETCVGGTEDDTSDSGSAGIVACAPGSVMEDSTAEGRCDEDSDPAGAFSSLRCMEDGTCWWMQFNVEPTTAGASAMSGGRALSHGVGEGPWPRKDSRRRRSVVAAIPAHA